MESHPREPDDLRRCLAFLDAVPSARPLLLRMAEVSRERAAVVGVWEKLERLFRGETASGSAQETRGHLKNVWKGLPRRPVVRPVPEAVRRIRGGA